MNIYFVLALWALLLDIATSVTTNMTVTLIVAVVTGAMLVIGASEVE